MSKSERTAADVNNEPRDPAFVFVPPGRRHSIPLRVPRGEATPEEMIHHLLGANADATLTGALAELHVLAEIVADRLAADRHVGTIANIIVSRLEVCIAISEQLDTERRAA